MARRPQSGLWRKQVGATETKAQLDAATNVPSTSDEATGRAQLGNLIRSLRVSVTLSVRTTGPPL
jgi:hypothetical protein